MKTKNVSLYRSIGAAACGGAVMLMASGALAQNLFVSAGDSEVYEYTPAGAQSTFASVSVPSGLAFDSAGDLFVGNNASGTISEWKAGFVSGQTPTVFASGLPGVTGLAFNSAGNLFVGGGAADSTIYEYTPGGVRSTFATGVGAAEGLAFNSAGDLFVANSSFSGSVTEITPGGAQSSLNITGLSEPAMLAFNSAGDLFIANQLGGNIVEYSHAGVQSNFATGVGHPWGLAFNNSGILFEGDANNSVINEFTPSGGEASFFSASGEQGLGWMTVQPVPEPSVLGLLGAGALLFVGYRRRGNTQVKRA
jgi:PEP-CTERM motif